MQMKERMQKVSCEIISYQKIGLAQKNYFTWDEECCTTLCDTAVSLKVMCQWVESSQLAPPPQLAVARMVRCSLKHTLML